MTASFVFFGLLYLSAIEPFNPSLPQEQIIANIERLVAQRPKDKSAAAYLKGALNPSNAIHVQERAAWAIGQLEYTALLPELLKAAEHPGLLVRSAAVNALMRIKPTQALPVLISIAQQDPVLLLRQKATLALGLIKSDKNAQLLADLSSDEKPEIRGASVLAMARLHSSKNNFSEILKEMTKDPSPYVQARAKAALNMINDKKETVRTYLTLEDFDIRLVAARYFYEKGMKADMKALKESANSEADEDVRYELNLAIRATQRRIKAKN